MAFNLIVRVPERHNSDVTAFVNVFVDIFDRLDTGADLNIDISTVLL